MKKIQLIISAAIMAIMVAACTEESTTEGGMTTVDQMFQQIKSPYKGSYISANNSIRQINFVVDEKANVVVNKFPLDLILAKLYPYDYSTIAEPTEPVVLTAPIKGFNIDASLNFIDFSTDESGTPPMEFTFTKDEVEHTGWAMVQAIGLYNMHLKTLTMQFAVTDLIVDGQDRQSLTPIYYFIDSAIKE